MLVLKIDQKRASAKSRLVALRIANLTLRLMENWRQFGDYEAAIIILAIAVINGEKLTRTPLESELQDLRTPVPRERLTRCNISSIAVATGLNRETTRRKVNKLVSVGLLVRNEDGSVNLAGGFSQAKTTIELVHTQLETLTRITNDLLRDGSLREGS